MKPVKTSRDRAAVLARLTESAKRQQAGAGERGQQPSVAVKILTAIPAGDSSQKTAMLMARNGGVLQETGQPVLVRHVGEGSVSAGAIVTPEPCGRLGLCFCFAGTGQPTPQVGIPINRRMRIVGPIAPELGTENKAWEFGQFKMWNNGRPFFDRIGHYGSFDFADTANRTTLPDGRLRWFYRMHPVRFQLDDWSSSHIAYGNYFGAWSADSNSRSAAYNSLWSFWDMVSMLNRGYDCGISGTTLGPNSHLSDMEVSGLALRPSAFLGHLWNTFYINPPIVFPNSSFYQLVWFSVYRLTHYRVWLDGADITGIVQLPGSGVEFDSILGGAGNSYQDFVRSSFAASPAISSAVRNSKTIAVDYWTSMELTTKDKIAQFGVPAIPSGRVVPQAFWITGEPSMPSSIVMADPSKKTTGKAWSLAFDVNGPGGLSSIQMVPQAGWSYTFANNSITLRQTSSPFDSVTLDWNREIPEITVRRPAYAVGGLYATWFFRPVATSDYAQNSIYRGPPLQDGVWNPDSATVFSISGGLISDNNGVGPNPKRHTKGEYNHWNLSFIYDNAPTQITVTPI